MAREIFISLTEHDRPIAEALSEAFSQVFGEGLLEAKYSPSRQVGATILSGEDWFRWIVERVKACHFALILVTPASVNKPWILWEAGAVAGAALALTEGDMRKVRPIVYQVPTELIPSPIRDAKAQFRRGDNAEDFRLMLDEIYDELAAELSQKTRREFATIRDNAVAAYLQKVQRALDEAPAVAAPAVIEEWLQRLDDLKRDKRASEAEHLHGWMNIAFGRVPKAGGARPPPLDLRIHSRLAELYLMAKRPRQAIAELQLAMQIAPRDIFTLRLLGKAQLDDGEREQARLTLERIKKLDARATVHNAECAALESRWHMEGQDPASAAAVLDAALKENPNSYYLADRLAQAQLEAGAKDAAAQAYQQALAIIQRLGEDNTWVLSTAANAAFFLGEDAQAVEKLRVIWRRGVDKGSWASIERGLQGLSGRVDNGAARLGLILGEAKT